VVAGSTITMTITRDLKDLTGLEYSTTYSWSFLLPTWLNLGNPAGQNYLCGVYDISIGKDALPAAVFSHSRVEGEHPTIAGDLYVRKWDGQSWVSLGTGRLNVHQGSDWTVASANIETAPDGSIFLSWVETDGAGVARQAHLRKWNGSSWVTVPGFVEAGEMIRAFAFEPNGDFLAAEFRTDGIKSIEVWKYTSSGRTALHSIGVPPLHTPREVRLQPNGGTIYSIWDGDFEHILRYNQTTGHSGQVAGWVPFIGSFEFHSDETITRAWLSGVESGLSVESRPFSSNTWLPVGLNPVEGQGHRPINVELDLDENGNPIVTYADPFTGIAHVKRFDGASWQELPSVGAPFIQDINWAGVKVLPTGEPLVYWRFSSGFFCREAVMYNGLF
jgi:hypothetical protein